MTRSEASGNLSPDRRSKYRRPRHLVSWWGILLGLIVGIAGGLVYAWVVNPLVEFDTEPWQLHDQDRAAYVAAITLRYSYDGDLNRAVTQLLALRLPGDPIQAVADIACRLASTDYIDNSSGQRAVRSMMQFYQLQGRAGCADNLLVINDQPTPQIILEVATPTLRPPATKTPTPPPAITASPTSQPIVIPTLVPQTDYVLVDVRTFCSAELSGLIEVRVQDFNGDPIPGEKVRVRWADGESLFFTGLKPERGLDYADFQMEAGKAYTVEVAGRSDPSQPLVAGSCGTDTGQEAITSYRVFFRPR